MPTNIHHIGQAVTYGNPWQAIGTGVTGLGQVLGQAMQANEANKLLKAQNEAKLAQKTDFNPILPQTSPQQPMQPMGAAPSSPLIGGFTRQPMQKMDPNGLSGMLSQYFNMPSY